MYQNTKTPRIRKNKRTGRKISRFNPTTEQIQLLEIVRKPIHKTGYKKGIKKYKKALKKLRKSGVQDEILKKRKFHSPGH